MHMGEVAGTSETLPIRAGRYLIPPARRWSLAILDASYLGYGSWNWGRPPGESVSVAVLALYAAALGLAVVSWFIPATVVDQWGIHRPFGRHRHILWADVADFLVVRTWRFARVEVQLPSARNVCLSGVPVSALREVPDRPSSLDLFQPRQLAPSRPSDATDDPWNDPTG
jgi:hypothetical protein